MTPLISFIHFVSTHPSYKQAALILFVFQSLLSLCQHHLLGFLILYLFDKDCLNVFEKGQLLHVVLNQIFTELRQPMSPYLYVYSALILIHLILTPQKIPETLLLML